MKPARLSCPGYRFIHLSLVHYSVAIVGCTINRTTIFHHKANLTFLFGGKSILVLCGTINQNILVGGRHSNDLFYHLFLSVRVLMILKGKPALAVKSHMTLSGHL